MCGEPTNNFTTSNSAKLHDKKVLCESCLQGPPDIKTELENIEHELADRLALPHENIRSVLIMLDMQGMLIEDELVADWHERHAQYVAFDVYETEHLIDLFSNELN